MVKLFQRSRGATPLAPSTALGAAQVAVRLDARAPVPAGAIGVVFDQAGRIRRLPAGARVDLARGETACAFHPGPYSIDVLPFAAAPEVGLRTTVAVDSPDPRVAQQRFDLFLASEAAGALTLADLAAAINADVQRELAQGHLELPPCTTQDEWHAFRAGLNRLLYTRFGLCIDDCIPVDLKDTVDYAAMLRARAVAEAPVAEAPVAVPAAPTVTAPVRFDAASMDAQAMRRLFLELPALVARLRAADLGAFGPQQALLQRLDLASLEVATMPALALAAPGQALAEADQVRRARATLRAAATLDEAWAWLARPAPAPDELERIASNLDLALAERRAVTGSQT